MHGIKVILLTACVSTLLGSALTFALMRTYTPAAHAPSKEDLIATYFSTEKAIKVSPYTLRKELDRGENAIVLVDIRSQQEYAEEHIVSAINIPAFANATTPTEEEINRVLESFNVLRIENPNKDIIIYCESASCMSDHIVGDILAQNGIYVKLLGIGWNEWRYSWPLWNHKSEWSSSFSEDYVARGEDPGIPEKR